MTDLWGEPWSNDPNAPLIPYNLYFNEKTLFAGTVIGSVFYGIVVVLFFQCIAALLDPINRNGKGIKWGFVAHTVAMFSFVTIYTAISIHIQLLGSIDNRRFPASDVFPPGPIGYQAFLLHKPISVVSTLAAVFNNWLADGLLLYRCYAVYSMNFWIIAFPCLMYLASWATGTMFVYQTALPVDTISRWFIIIDFGTAYYSIAVSLNVILTLMIIMRLVMHSRRVREATGGQDAAGRSYNSVVVMLVESCALHSVAFVLYIALWAAVSPVANVFLPVFVEIQVIAQFLIIIRAAKRSASTREPTVYGTTTSIHFRKDSGGIHPEMNSISLVNAHGKSTADLGGAQETAIGFYYNDRKVVPPTPHRGWDSY